MKNSILLGLLTCLVFAVATSACKSDPKDANGTDAATGKSGALASNDLMTSDMTDDKSQAGEDAGKSFISDEQHKQGLLGLLKGKWQNLGEPSETLEFDGNQIIYFKNGKEAKRTTVQLDFTCANSPCKNIKNRRPGWCLVEDGKCKSVTRLDLLYYIVEPSDGSAGKSQYKRMNN